MGVYITATRSEALKAIKALIKSDQRYLREALPAGTVIDPAEDWPIVLKNLAVMSEADRRVWLTKTLNIFVNVLRPRLRKWHEESVA